MLVGLGNPGFRYKRTRHNIGFMVIDTLRKSHGFPKSEKQTDYFFASKEHNEKDVIIAKPLTFMNRSGAAVNELVGRFGIPLNNLLIILDDFHLQFGKLRVRSKGSDGGHNGLASIIDELGSSDFSRIRVGIGREGLKDTVKFVLSKFDKKEKKELLSLINLAAEACFHFVTEGINNTMNRFNQDRRS